MKNLVWGRDCLQVGCQRYKSKVYNGFIGYRSVLWFVQNNHRYSLSDNLSAAHSPCTVPENTSSLRHVLYCCCSYATNVAVIANAQDKDLSHF